MRFRLSGHALDEMNRRSISLEFLNSVLENPQEIVSEHGGKKAYQSQLDFGGKIYLVRAIVADDVDPAVVVTVYRTSRISRYWRGT